MHPKSTIAVLEPGIDSMMYAIERHARSITSADPSLLMRLTKHGRKDSIENP